MNWSAVCGSYTAGALLYLFPEEFAKQKKRLLKTLDCYIKGFTDDGLCLEGPLYWLYGFTAYSAFADLLYRYSGGKVDLFSCAKVRKVAAYGGSCLLKGNTAVSFSDADMSFLPDYSLQCYLTSRLPDEVPFVPPERLCFYDANTKWMNYYRAYLYSDYAVQTSQNASGEIYSPCAHQLIINKAAYSFAIKGGHNDEPHNHNDLGAFIYSDSDGQVFCDLGSGRYTKDYFDDKKRYGIFCNSSYGHSVPVIDKKAQASGKEFSASLKYKNGVALCDMTKAYKDENLVFLERKISLAENGVTLTDSFSFKKSTSVTERFISLRKATVKDGLLIFGNTYMRYSAEDAALSIKEEKHTPHEYDKEDITVYCYDFILNEDVNEIVFEITTENN